MALENYWRYKSIEDLEKQNFGDPDEAPTNLVRRCLELCKVPIDNFEVEDLRLMIGQNFSLRYLMPIAIEHLQKDIFAEGDLYPGDLLKNVLCVDAEFWKSNEYLWKLVDELIRNRRDELAGNQILTTIFDSVWC